MAHRSKRKFTTPRHHTPLSGRPRRPKPREAPPLFMRASHKVVVPRGVLLTAQVEAKPRGQGYSRQATLIMRIFDYKTIPRGSPSNQEVEPAQPHSPKIPILRIALGKRFSRQPGGAWDFFLLMRESFAGLPLTNFSRSQKHIHLWKHIWCYKKPGFYLQNTSLATLSYFIFAS